MIEKMEVSITNNLFAFKNRSIKKILDILDMTEIKETERKKLRKCVLEELNSFYFASCDALTYIQEKRNGDRSKNG